MSGHSKWANIKRAKGAADAKRGAAFTKLTREIMVAAKEGGASVEGNFRLRLAVEKARQFNMPLENIDRAIKKATGEGVAGGLAEVTLEGYGPSGAAILVQAMTDNRLRTIQDIRNIFSRHGGTMGGSGSVAWLFESKGTIAVKAGDINADDLTLIAIDAGADDVNVDGGMIEISTKPEDLEKVKTALEQKNIKLESVDLSMQPKTLVHLDEKAALQAMKLLEKLEELEEVQNVASNADFDPAVVEKYQLQQA